MHELMIQPPYCDPNLNCGMKELTPIFFCLFFMLSNYILLNILVAIVLDNFADASLLSNAPVTDTHFISFKESWVNYDPDGTMYIPSAKVGH